MNRNVGALFLAVSLGLAVSAADAATVSLASFNGTHSGPRATSGASAPLAFKHDPTKSVSPSQLPPGGVATFSTTIAIDKYAANWTNGGNLLTVGFVRDLADEASPQVFAAQHDGDPLIWFQNNNPAGIGFCWDKEFNIGGGFGPGQFVFTQSGVAQCGVANDDASQTAPRPGSLANYTVAIKADNTYALTVELLDADGQRVTNTAGWWQNANPHTITGTLPLAPTASYSPYIRMRPGYDTGGNGIDNPDSPWTFTVTNAKLESPVLLADKDVCKKDGWRQFIDPVFKNQGDCVSTSASPRR